MSALPVSPQERAFLERTRHWTAAMWKRWYRRAQFPQAAAQGAFRSRTER